MKRLMALVVRSPLFILTAILVVCLMYFSGKAVGDALTGNHVRHYYPTYSK